MPLIAGTFRRASANGIPDVYLVVLNDGVPGVAATARALGRAHGGTVEEVWEHALQGFVVRMPEARARRLAQDPRVRSVEQNFDVVISAPVGDCYRTGPSTNTRLLPTSSASSQPLSCGQPDPMQDPNRGNPSAPPLCIDNWGLDRIDQTSFTRNQTFTFINNGSPVHVYVMDTGIRATHREFLDANGNSRVFGGADVRTAAPQTPDTSDCHGHGTHVAAIIGGRTYGVAKNAILHPVRISSCRGEQLTLQANLDVMVRGLNWIAANAQRPAVINWSGGNAAGVIASPAVRTAVQGVLNAGIVLVQAAGNGTVDACDLSFGGLFPDVFVAGGMDEYDGRWIRRLEDEDDFPQIFGGDSGSNGGSCIDIWAPAAHIISAAMDHDSATCRLSGTSMAAPHVTGVVAAYLESNQNATIAEVESALRSRGTWGVLQSSATHTNFIGPDSDNVVLFSDTREAGPDPAPVAAFSISCAGRRCTFAAAGSSNDVTDWRWRFGDGAEGSGATAQHVYSAGFTGRATLRVADAAGKTDHLRQELPPITDAPPAASFTYSCAGRTCSFNGSASTDDHAVASWSWTFGDATNGSGETTTHTYGGTAMSFSVTLTVTDSAGQTNAQQQTITIPATPPPSAMRERNVSCGDFNGDGRGEIVWKHGVTRDYAMWELNGRTIVDGSVFANESDPAWQVQGLGDFNGDGRDDLFLRHSTTGATKMMFMNGRTVVSSGSSTTVSDANWRMQAVGDFNGDDRDELIWRHAVTGEVAMWEVNGATLLNGAVFYTVADLSWELQLAADFNGDGKDELLWRHASTGQVAMWDLQGRTLVNGNVFFTLSSTQWRLVAAGDFNDDGRADLLWRHASNDVVAMWEMNHRTILNGNALLTLSSPAWQAQCTGDFNLSGPDEVIWQHSQTGETAMWELSGHTLLNGAVFHTVPDLNWKVQPQR